MRIALVAHHARPTGGQDRYVLELAKGLAPRHDVHVIAVGAEGLDGHGVTVHELPLRERPVLWLSPRFARLAAAAARSGFDVVHGIGGALPGASVITAQYCHAAWRDAQRRHSGERVGGPAALYHVLHDAQARAYERRAYADRRLRAVIAVSRRTGDEITRHYHVDPRTITVIHNGVDLDVFDRDRYPTGRADLRSPLGLAPDAPVALLVGTYVRKGLATAIAAVARASSTLHLVVAGTGPDALARSWARQAGLADRLHLLGPRADIARLFAGADLFILPTRYEPFGMVIAEAMASRLPVVVSACAGAAEIITHGSSGFVVPEADDADGFAAAIRDILASPARAKSVGEAARTAAAAVGWGGVVAQTEGVYARAVGRA